MALGDVLGRLGVRRVFGDAVGGGIDDPVVRGHAAARLLAEADGAVGAGVGAWWTGSTLTITSCPGAEAERATVASPQELVDAFADARVRGAGAIALELGFDLSDDRIPTTPIVRDPSLAAQLPAPDLPDDGGRYTFDLVLAGSNIIRARAVEALRELADRTGLGVLNVFTAKGLFRWDSPYHLGTAGLQLHDFGLAGLAPDRPVLAIGVGADECPDVIMRDAGLTPDGNWPIVRATTEHLDALPGRVRASHDGPPALGPLYERLSAVVQPLYLLADVPLNPARAAADIAETLPEGGVVTLEPGTTGWWVARALPTTQLGSVRVPAVGRPGLSVAAAVLASMEGKPAVAVVESLSAPETRSMVELARERDANIVVAVWGAEGEIGSSEEHRNELRVAFDKPGVTVIRVPVAFDDATAQLVDAAGPLAAWKQQR